MHALDVEPAPEVVGSALLHPRWKFWPYVWRYARYLRHAPAVYTRVVPISLALARAGIKHHLELHNIQSLIDNGDLAKVIENHRRALVQTLIPISAGAADVCLTQGGVAERIHVAHSGVKLESYKGVAPFDPSRMDKPEVVHLGRLSTDRGLAVFRDLAEQGLCKVIVVSGDRHALPNIDYRPPVALRDVPAWYSKSDLTLLPYQPEIPTVATMSPIKMFEAMAAGRPIIASDLPTIREVLAHEKTALLVSPNDLRGWREAVARLKTDRVLAAKLASAARNEASRYSWKSRAHNIGKAIGLAERPGT